MIQNLDAYRYAIVESAKNRFMVDGVKYNLSDFTIHDRRMPNDNIMPVLEHKTGFWFGLSGFCACFDTPEDAMNALENGKTIIRFHKVIYGKSIKHYVVEF